MVTDPLTKTADYIPSWLGIHLLTDRSPIHGRSAYSRLTELLHGRVTAYNMYNACRSGRTIKRASTPYRSLQKSSSSCSSLDAIRGVCLLTADLGANEGAARSFAAANFSHSGPRLALRYAAR